MAETQKGGIYRVGDEFVDANGNKVKPAKEASTEPPEDPSVIPSEFPGAQVLARNGWTTWAHLEGKGREELIALRGVGDATADEIMAAYAKRSA